MPLVATPIYINLMGMAEELERAQLVVKLDGYWLGHLCMLMMLFWWQTQGQSCRLCWMW